MYWCRVREESHQAVGVAPTLLKIKTPAKISGGFKFIRRGRDLNPRNLAVYRFSRPAVSTTHTPLQLCRRRVAGIGHLFLL